MSSDRKSKRRLTTGVKITSGKYSFILSENILNGGASMVDTNYLDNSYVTIIEE